MMMSQLATTWPGSDDGWNPLKSKAAVVIAHRWPTPNIAMTGSFGPLDVDRYGDIALVLSAFRGPSGYEQMYTETFAFDQATRDWRYRRGSGVGGLYTDRWSPPRVRPHPHPLEVSPVLVSDPLHRGLFGHVTILCGLDVAMVEVARPGGTRRADVSHGPGWLGVVWPGGDEPMVKAFAADGSQVDALSSDEFVFDGRLPTCFLRDWV
jgi:hypothetical protein